MKSTKLWKIFFFLFTMSVVSLAVYTITVVPPVWGYVIIGVLALGMVGAIIVHTEKIEIW